MIRDIPLLMTEYLIQHETFFLPVAGRDSMDVYSKDG